ncbi:MAG TPA: right-handed parallel beta-helix repeat-containing protein [Tepidisphaeraceae bacterium]|nr:right-handed parallel beta-helix repeat-containing protein [Tepidisphaeraceae bacterium]
MRHLFFLLGLSIAAQVFAADLTADFFVATNGNDNWSGKLPAPNAAGNDGPFATIAKAQGTRAANAAKLQTILVRGGTYFLPKPLSFTAADSNLTIAAYPNESPIFSGGQRITGWKKDAHGWWTVNLPEVKSGKWSFVQLFADGQRRYRPRLPKEGYYNIADAAPPSAKSAGKGSDRFVFKAGEVRGDWHNLADVEVIGFQVWTMARLRIESVDEASRLVTFTGPTRSMQHWSALSKGRRFLVENVREALERPGEWYLDSKTGDLTYIPMPGEDPDRMVIIAPKLERLVQIQSVQKLILRGLTFEHSNWSTPTEGNNYSQAEVNLGGAISLSNARDCAIENCTVRSVGTYAIDIADNCHGNRVENCTLTDLGAGGVKIGLTRFEQNQELITSHQIIRNNIIAHGGRLHPAAIGVWIGHSPYNTVEHNDIFDFYYTGVSVGWSWGYAPCGSHHNTIAWNHIYNIGQGVLSDMGGIYTLGLAPGSILHHNLIHDVQSFDYGGWGIYFDEGTSEMTAENNIVYNTKTGGFHQHYGKENIVRNNIFAFANEHQLQRSRAEPHRSFTFEHNIVYWKSGPLLGSVWNDDKFTMDYNLYWREAGGSPIDQKWRDRGHDVHSIIADPMFENPDKGGFRLKAGSPASQVDFKPIDLTGVGASSLSQPANVPAAFPTNP